LDVSIEYIRNPSTTLGDKIVIIRRPASNGFMPLERVELSGDHQPGLPDVDLSQIPFDEYQAGFEATASVTRIPGTKNAKAKIQNIRIKTGPRNAIGDWTNAALSENNLEIRLVDPNNQAGLETQHLSKDPITGATSHLHYNVQLANSYTLLLWDKYNWRQRDARLW
jgi:hypothetical protein